MLWDGTKLFTLAHQWNSGSSGRAELRRFSYNAANDQYTQELGPILVNNFGSETAVLAKDTTGTLWVTYTQDSKVYVTRSAGANHDTWVTPYILPTAGSSVYSDDISAIVSFGGKIGVLWSNQCDQTQGRCSTIQNKMLFAWHSDGAADNAWTEEVAYDIPSLSGGSADEAADDHMNIKVDSSGRLYAAFKTSLNASGEPLIGLLVRETNGTWSSRTVFTADFNHTRPIVLIDEQNGVLYVFASEGPTTQRRQDLLQAGEPEQPLLPGRDRHGHHREQHRRHDQQRQLHQAERGLDHRHRDHRRRGPKHPLLPQRDQSRVAGWARPVFCLMSEGRSGSAAAGAGGRRS